MTWRSLDAVLKAIDDQDADRRRPAREARLLEVRGEYDPEPEELDDVPARRGRARENQERDAEIRRLAHEEHVTGAALTVLYSLSHQRISQILREEPSG